MESKEEYLSRRRRNPKQKEFFDERADHWDEMCVHDGGKVTEIADMLDLGEGCRVLDVGTGTGVMILFYLERIGRGHVTAVDYSGSMIAVAKRKNPESDRLSYRVQDIYGMTDESAFDRVVCYSCFPHFPDPVRAIEILARALAPGGMLCIAHSSSRDHINTVHREGGEVISADYLPPAAIMGELMEDAGLEVGVLRDDDGFYIVTATKPSLS